MPKMKIQRSAIGGVARNVDEDGATDGANDVADDVLAHDASEAVQ